MKETMEYIDQIHPLVGFLLTIILLMTMFIVRLIKSNRDLFREAKKAHSIMQDMMPLIEAKQNLHFKMQQEISKSRKPSYCPTCEGVTDTDGNGYCTKCGRDCKY